VNEEQFRELRPGDVVRAKTGHDSWIVTGYCIDGEFVVAVQTIAFKRPEEWVLVKKVYEVQEEK